MKFIVPIPDVLYYCWQILVQINNFHKYDYDIETHYLIGVFNKKPTDQVKKMAASPQLRCKFHFYDDERPDKTYTAGLKPYLVHRYFTEFPEEKDSVYCYVDPDLIFLKIFNFEPFIHDDIWWGSDVSSYLGSQYIKSKGEGLFEEMCQYVNIDPKIVEANDRPGCIGAQYITKNNDPQFWWDVYFNSNALYKHLLTRKNHYFKPEMGYWLQVWTNEMWLTIWELWKRGIQTKHANEFCFHWANHQIKDKIHTMFHNAGVTKADGINFSKIDYQTSPFNKELVANKTSISWFYAQEVKETEVNYPDLVW